MFYSDKEGTDIHNQKRKEGEAIEGRKRQRNKGRKAKAKG